MCLEIAEKLKIDVKIHKTSVNDPRELIMLLLGQWLPVSRTVFRMVSQHVPSPLEMSDDRAQKLLFPMNAVLESYPMETLKVKENIVKCNKDSEDIVIYVSKMVPINVDQLRHKSLPSTNRSFSTNVINQLRTKLDISERENRKESELLAYGEESGNDVNTTRFVAFARIYSGTLSKGQTLYYVTPKHDPRNRE